MIRSFRPSKTRPPTRSWRACFRPTFEILENRHLLSSSTVVINELQTAGVGGATDEFIEIYNMAATPTDLSGWKVAYRSAAGITDVTLITLPALTTISGNSFLLLGGPGWTGPAPDFSYVASSMAAAGGGVALRDPSLAVVDSVGYGTATNAFVEGTVALAPPGSQSIERVPAGTDTDNNSIDFIVQTTPTPRFGLFNSAPVLDNSGNPTLDPINQDDTTNNGTLVSAIIASVAPLDMITDADAAYPEGIAVTGLDNTNGSWEYSTDNGGMWTAFSSPSDGNALLLNADANTRVRFVPGTSFNGPVTDGLTFRAWDQTAGTNGGSADTSSNGGTTPFSMDSEAASITVNPLNPLNQAPVLDNSGSPKLPTIPRNATNPVGLTVANIVSTSVMDADAGALQGIAVVGLTGAGNWRFSLDGGGNWQAFGPVADGSARLLRDSDRVRFVPTLNVAGTGSINFHAWDQTSGLAGDVVDVSVNGGNTAFSTDADTATIEVAMTLTPIKEDTHNSKGTKVANILSPDFKAANPGLKGIAVSGLDSSNGTWKYSLNGGLTWKNFVAVAETAARLLATGDKVRFRPNLNFNGMATITYHSWDRTTGARGGVFNLTLGSPAFSTGTDLSFLTVLPVNDRPVLATSGNPTLPLPNDAVTVGSLLAGAVTDVDAGALQGIAIIAKTGTLHGTWQYSLDGGTIWTHLSGVSSTKALLLRDTDMIRFVPQPGFTGPATIKYRAWDQTKGVAGGFLNPTLGTAFSLAMETASQNFV